MQEPQGLEQLPTELRQEVYFYVGFPVGGKLYTSFQYMNGVELRAQLSAIVRSFVTRKRGVYLDYGLQIEWIDRTSRVHHCCYRRLQKHPLLMVNRQFRHELLSLLFNAGLQIFVAYVEAPSSWTAVVRPTAMAYITSAKIRRFPTLFWRDIFKKRDGDTLSFLGACTPNLRELTIQTNFDLQPISPEAAFTVHRWMRSLHRFASTASENQLKVIRLQWSDSNSQVIYKKDFDKICTLGNEVILQLHNFKRGDISELQEVDIDSLRGHTYSDGNCDDRFLTWDFQGLEDTFFSDLD